MILTAQWVLPIETEAISKGAVVVEEDYIEAVGKQNEIMDKYPEHKIKDLGSAIILPGMVNIHTHLDYTVLRGEKDNLAFLPWVGNLVHKSRSLTEKEVLLSAKLGALELLASGVTAFGDATATGASLQAAVWSGLRGTVYQEVFGMDDEKIDGTLSALEQKFIELREDSNSRLRVGLSPHAPYSVSRRLLKEVSSWAEKEGIPLSMHLAETEEEVSFLQEGTGPFATTYRQAVGWEDIPWQEPGVSPVRYLAELDMLTENLLVVHLVQTEKGEFDLLSQTDVKVAHCPKSNAKLGAGIANLSAMLDVDLTVGLGTDSAASNNSLDLFSEMEFGVLLQRANQKKADAVTAEEIVKLATIKGAEALSLDEEIGSLKPGKKADLTAVRIDNPANQPVYDPYSTLVHTASSRDVILTMIAGQEVYEKGGFKKAAADGILVEIDQVTDKIDKL